MTGIRTPPPRRIERLGTGAGPIIGLRIPQQGSSAIGKMSAEEVLAQITPAQRSAIKAKLDAQRRADVAAQAGANAAAKLVGKSAQYRASFAAGVEKEHLRQSTVLASESAKGHEMCAAWLLVASDTTAADICAVLADQPVETLKARDEYARRIRALHALRQASVSSRSGGAHGENHGWGKIHAKVRADRT